MRIVTIKEDHKKAAANILNSGYISPKEFGQFLNQRIKLKEGFVAVINQRVVGVLLYARDYSHYANYITDIIVGKDYRRKGVATKLLEKFIQVSRKEQPKKQEYALSSTHVDNKASIKMHLSFGFEELGRVKKLHYGKDEIIFGYKL